MGSQEFLQKDFRFQTICLFPQGNHVRDVEFCGKKKEKKKKTNASLVFQGLPSFEGPEEAVEHKERPCAMYILLRN